MSQKRKSGAVHVAEFSPDFRRWKSQYLRPWTVRLPFEALSLLPWPFLCGAARAAAVPRACPVPPMGGGNWQGGFLAFGPMSYICDGFQVGVNLPFSSYGTFARNFRPV